MLRDQQQRVWLVASTFRYGAVRSSRQSPDFGIPAVTTAPPRRRFPPPPSMTVIFSRGMLCRVHSGKDMPAEEPAPT